MNDQHDNGPFWKNYYAMIEDVQAAVKRGERIELDDNVDARTLGYVSQLHRWTIHLVTVKQNVWAAANTSHWGPTPRQKLINELMKYAKTRRRMCTEILPEQ